MSPPHPFEQHPQRRLSVGLLHIFQEHYGEYGTRVAFSPDSAFLATCDESRSLLLWDVNRNRYLPWLPYESSYWGLDTLLDAALLDELTRAGQARIWPFERLREGERPWHDLFSTDASSVFLCWGPDCLVEMHFPKLEQRPTVSRDGRLFFVAGEIGRIGIYETLSLQEIGSFESRSFKREDGREVLSSSYTTIEALSSDSTLIVVKDALRLKPLPEGDSYPSYLHSVQVWEIRQPGSAMRRIGAVEGHRFGDVAFSPDNRLLAIALNDCVQIYQARTLEPLASVNRSNDIISVGFSSDGRYLATGGWDGDVWIWDTLTWHEAAGFAAHPDCEKCRMTGEFQSLGDIAWSPDGMLMATSGEENNGPSVRLWLVDEE